MVNWLDEQECTCASKMGWVATLERYSTWTAVVLR